LTLSWQLEGAAHVPETLQPTAQPVQQHNAKDTGHGYSSRFQEKVCSSRHQQAPLPAEWESKVDVVSGRLFYVHLPSGETSWTPPEASTKASQPAASQACHTTAQHEGAPASANSCAALPEGWVVQVDPASGRMFFAHPASGVTSWDAPTPEQTPPINTSADKEIPATPEPVGGPRLPDGWEVHLDPATSRSFYAHPATGQSSWMPPGATECVEHAVASEAVALVPASECMEPELPAGWEVRADPVTGRTFYAHPATGQSLWDPPLVSQERAPAAMASASVSRSVEPQQPVEPQQSVVLGWEMRIDPASGRTYYAHPTTKETSWDSPSMHDMASSRAPSVSSVASVSMEPQLPEGWDMREDPATGRSFYAHPATGQSSWTLPEACLHPQVAPATLLPESAVENLASCQPLQNKTAVHNTAHLSESVCPGATLMHLANCGLLTDVLTVVVLWQATASVSLRTLFKRLDLQHVGDSRTH
jgi:hypothetical protein